MQFLKLGIHPRMNALGDASVVLGSDAASAYTNPALLSLSANSSVQLSHKTWLAGTTTDFIGAKTSLNDFSFSVFLNTTNIPGFEVRTRPGPLEGMFDVHYFATGLSSAYALSETFSFGVNAKILYEKIFVDDATGFAADFGASHLVNDVLLLGASVNNIGSMSSLRSSATTLPTSARIGGSYTFIFPALNADMLVTTDGISFFAEKSNHLVGGVEFTYDRMLALRAGWQTGFEARNFFSAGLGITYNSLIFDYAFVPAKYSFDSGHTIAVGYIFH